jgi:hypothetical protein
MRIGMSVSLTAPGSGLRRRSLGWGSPGLTGRSRGFRGERWQDTESAYLCHQDCGQVCQHSGPAGRSLAQPATARLSQRQDRSVPYVAS